MAEEQEQVELARGGNNDALAALLAEAAPGLRARCIARIRGDGLAMVDAEDVLQVTFLEAFLRISRFEYRGAGAFGAWLARIMDNNLTDVLRGVRARRPQEARRADADPSDSAANLAALLGWTSTTPSRTMMREELRDLVLGGLARLPEDYRRVIQFYELEGRSPEDVAGLMSRSVGAVFMLRARALERLREVLSGVLDFSAPQA
ncbi:ECF RNA polymerase sigma-E factor [Phycisphaerae bacterium RAS1]|nr:ECF RNA polymerase sigma-E factor [Phycisphaerae bacterium RAS1]